MWGEGTVLDVDVGPNLYAYTRQNPWSKFDPLGLDTNLIGPVHPDGTRNDGRAEIASSDNDDYDINAHSDKVGFLRWENVPKELQVGTRGGKFYLVKDGKLTDQDISKQVREYADQLKAADYTLYQSFVSKFKNDQDEFDSARTASIPNKRYAELRSHYEELGKKGGKAGRLKEQIFKVHGGHYVPISEESLAQLVFSDSDFPKQRFSPVKIYINACQCNSTDVVNPSPATRLMTHLANKAKRPITYHAPKNYMAWKHLKGGKFERQYFHDTDQKMPAPAPPPATVHPNPQ